MQTKPKRTIKEIASTLGIRQDGSGPKRSKRWAIITILLLAVLLAAWIGLGGEKKVSVEYKTEEVVQGDLTVIVTATGNLAPTNEVEVGSELSGIVKTVETNFNGRVKVGQVLARLDNTKYEAAVMESRAALASAEAKSMQARATLQLKEQNLKRLRQAHKLSEGKAPSLGELEVAEADLQRAKADENATHAAIQQAKARLKIDENNLSKTIIYSPINGVVLKRNVDPGQTVAASLQAPILFTLAEDLTKMELQVDVDEADVGVVQEGQTASFTVDAYAGRTFTARIAQLRYGSQVTNGVVTYATLLYVDNPDLVLRPGMTATAKIVTKRIAKSILIPNAALRFAPPLELEGTTARRGLFGMLLGRPKPDGRLADKDKRWKIGQTKVWILENNQLVAIGVSIGSTDGVQTVIKEGGLEPGMQVVVDAIYDK